jgi:hypothetical protein
MPRSSGIDHRAKPAERNSSMAERFAEEQISKSYRVRTFR